MDFRVLGPLEVVGDHGPLPLGGPKQRAVLAHLVLRANRLVPAELLIDELWGDQPPETARNTLQTYVYRLRKLLGGRLESRDGGYSLEAAPEEIDAARFESMVREAKALAGSDPGAAAAKFAQALSLWRGEALGDLGEEPSLRGEVARLEEMRLSATEHRIAAQIATGGHSTVVSELESLTARYPLRERMWANLMLARYRLGRQAEALATYQRAREVLAEELGTDPSEELQRLHERILRGDPALGRVGAAPKTSVPRSRVDLPPGTEFAGYRIVSTLGRGGMSVVYLAEHDWLQRKVALKLLAPQLAEDERFRERFVRESRLAASLDHPNVIPIYEAGASGGDLFIAMRYVEGTDLRRLLHGSGALEHERALGIVRQVAAALDAAHEQGLVHRDVKPGNVLLARPRGSEAGEHVYLSDFGLTKRSASDSGVTGTGQFVGTLDYAAPEQFTGGELDARTDVYSLGCVLFECLTGHPPFRADNDAGLMYAHLQEPPPSVLLERPDLPHGIDPIIAKAMSKAPDERHPTAGSLVGAATEALGVGQPSLSAGGRRSLLRRLIPAVAVVAALIVGLALSSALRGETPRAERVDAAPGSPSPSPSPTPEPAFRTVDRALSAEEERLLAYIPVDVATDCKPLDRDEPVRGELAALVCRPPDVEVLYELFPTRDLMDAAFQINANVMRAPDGECATDTLAVTPYTIAGDPAGRILCYTVEAGFARQDSDVPASSHVEWTDENASIYAHAVRNDLGDLTLYEWWLTSSGPAAPGADGAVKDRAQAAPAVALGTGSFLVAPARGCAGFEGEVCGLHIEGGSYVDSIYPFGPDNERGTLLLQKPNAIVFTPHEGYCLGPTTTGGGGDSRPAVYTWTAKDELVSFERESGGRCAGPQKMDDGEPWTRAPDGQIALEIAGQIALMEPGGSGVEFPAEALTSEDGLISRDPDWSPDGSTLVFAGTGTEGDDDLFVMGSDGSELTQITDDPGAENQPDWSPDGSRIVFVSDTGGSGGADEPFRTAIVLADPDGGGWTELHRSAANEDFGWPAWSPDGTRIAFSAKTGQGFRVVVIDADGSDIVTVYEQRESLPDMPVSWTPDGERIVFWGERAGEETLLSVRPDGSRLSEFLPELPPEARTLTIDWSPDGHWLVAAPAFGQTATTAQPSIVLLIRADGSEVFPIAASGSEPSWRPLQG